MKKILILSFGLVAVFASCKKSNPTSNSPHLTCTIDGSSQSFNSGLVAVKQSTGGVYTLQISGSSAATGGSSFVIQMSSITVGGTDSFTVRSYPDTSSLFNTGATYIPAVSSPFTFYEGGSYPVSGSVRVTNHTVITITAIDTKSVKGTFSGDFFLNGDASSTKKSVTSGDFYATF